MLTKASTFMHFFGTPGIYRVNEQIKQARLQDFVQSMMDVETDLLKFSVRKRVVLWIFRQHWIL